MMKRISCGWNIIRLMRMLMGIAATAQGIIQKEGWFIAAGVLLLLSALFDIACYSSAGCTVPLQRGEAIKEIDYEELGDKK